MLMVLFLLQMFICFLCSLGHNGWRMKPEPGYPEPWYIQNIDERQYIFMSYIIIYNTMIPLSLYVSMELSRAVNGRHINQDKLMYDPVSRVQSQARNTNIVEELGAIKYVFTDKTGTLTCNQMVFVQCSIAGLRYGYDGTPLIISHALHELPLISIMVC
jgi:magnesium-transporting ATPase (P-type)